MIESEVVEIDLLDDGRNTTESASFVFIQRLTVLKLKKRGGMGGYCSYAPAKKLQQRCEVV